MSRVGVSVTKSIPFRDSTQEFSNVYYFENNAALPDAAGADNLIDAVVVIEKTFHSTGVTFLRGRCWSQLGSPSANNMISQKNLSGTGARAVISYDKERAFLFRLRAGNDSRGQPVYMRKWFHACGAFYSGQSIATGIIDNTTGFSTTERSSQEGQVQGLRQIVLGANTWNLVSKSGRAPGVGASFEAHKYFEHHQLGDMWRAQ